MERTTKRIDPASVEGRDPIATGYKIFSWDWSAYGGYNYADENGNVESSVHTVTGELSTCGWGLHYCKNPLDCMKYQNIIQWNRFAYVEVFDENIDTKDKSVCRTMKIAKTLNFEEMVDACKNYQSYISGGSDISGGSRIKHCANCEGVSRCIFCYGLEGAKLRLFNKPVSDARFDEVYLALDGWYPRFNNAEELKKDFGAGKWECTPVSAITARTAKEAYADMPAELIKYIKSLPEYDEEIFKKITEDE